MKKSKLLIPLLTVGSAVAVVAPIMTSCSQGEKDISENPIFMLTTGAKETVVYSPTLSHQIELEFTSSESFEEKEATLIEPIAVVTKANSYITLNQCWKQSCVGNKLKFIISFTINSEAYVYKEKEGKKAENETVEFNIKIHNGTWTQTTKGFSIIAWRNDKQ